MIEELIGFLFDVISEVFDDSADVPTAEALEISIPEVAESQWKSPESDADPSSWVTANDGGISSDRFDPQPAKGPFTP